eukprot:PITA_29406
MLNIYGPYHHRENLWERILGTNIFQADNLIIGRYLNFSLGFSESWGLQAQTDPLVGYFEQLLDSHDLIDIPVAKLALTWSSETIGEASLARRLDRFLIKEHLLEQGYTYRQWVGSDFWKAHPLDKNGDIIEGFMANLKELKKISKIWAHNKRCDDEHQVNEIEKEMVNLKENSGDTSPTPKLKDKLVDLTALRGKILKDKEETWRLRSQPIWLREGDDNTKFYHKFSNGRRAINTIWKLTNEQGVEVDTFPHLASLVTSHFKQVYQNPPNATLVEVI